LWWHRFFDKKNMQAYHSRLISARIARQTVFSGDSLHFARSGASESGALDAGLLPRLADSLRPEDGAVQYRLSGATVRGRPVLRLEVSATLHLVCQRCLAELAHPVSLHSVLPVARDEAELARWERDDPLLDALVAERHMDLPALVEDEILLSLPAVPRHADGACATAATWQV
jgi:uncharacterized protein